MSKILCIAKARMHADNFGDGGVGVWRSLDSGSLLRGAPFTTYFILCKGNSV
jgi:hypothetical protein